LSYNVINIQIVTIF